MPELDFLSTREILDCAGRTTHRLVLDLDGSVRVTIVSSGRTVRIDPATRQILTPGGRLADDIIRLACELRADVG